MGGRGSIVWVWTKLPPKCGVLCYLFLQRLKLYIDFKFGIQFGFAKVQVQSAISSTFVICWCPNNIFYLFATYSIQTCTLAVGYYPTMFLVYLNICMNPFIYAVKHEGVKKQLARLMIKCHKSNEVGDESTGQSGPVDGTQQRHTGVTQK